MKVSLEVLDSSFIYSYDVGTSKATGTMTLNADNLVLFTNVLSACHRSCIANTETEINEIKCMAYIEKHPELLKRYKELSKK